MSWSGERMRHIYSARGIKTVLPRTVTIQVEDAAFVRNIVNGYKIRIQQGEWIVPIFIDKDNHQRIVDGNHRAQAYKELGMEIPAIYVDRIKTLQLLVNKSPLQVYHTLIGRKV